MAAISLGDPRLNRVKAPRSPHQHHHGVVLDEIEGLLRVYKDGHVERVPVVPEVPCTWSPEPDVVSRDVALDLSTRIWARLYSPVGSGGGGLGRQSGRLPVLVYFHGGGFCVASAAWTCYHEFLARLASRAGCLVMSVNYRLAPEHRLPAAFEDGLTAVKWLRQQASHGHHDEAAHWWCGRCDLSRVFLGGDSAGATIAHHVAIQVSSQGIPVSPRGVILIQPFFGGEARTASENIPQPPGSVLSLVASDAYWRLSLPAGASRDHPWCNPLAAGGVPSLEELSLPAYFVCISEMDILKDRDMELCRAMRRAGKSVEVAVHAGVGHAFQVLGTSRTSQSRAQEMIAQLKCFLNR
ncbi:hypothetical protein Taro_022251 [Colocasia esculenta]|uniref:Alpha/beta hydrolase fold-3 domain-containing protein n=1 Tax=Colocasia esculenta TaxID=4460 RepID=A0A843V1A7_COLES|nr:hypothetical protein [Colocasia esculenta]